jgi:hypothetical protein
MLHWCKMGTGYEKILAFSTSSTNLRKYSLKIPKFFTGLLWTLKIPVNDLVLVEVVHPCGDLLGPLHQLLGRHVLAYTQTGPRVQRPHTLSASRDGILRHQFNKRLGTLSPCYSQYFFTGVF